MGLWAQRKAKERRNGQQQPPTSLSQPTRPVTYEEFKQAVKDGTIPRRGMRARSKQLKDQAHQSRDLEKKRIYQEAFWDQLDSPGEVVALTGSEVLGVTRADVIRDPKQRPLYRHPSMREFEVVMSADGRRLISRPKRTGAAAEGADWLEG